MQVKLTKNSCFRTLFKAWFMDEFGLFRVRFRQVHCILSYLFSYSGIDVYVTNLFYFYQVLTAFNELKIVSVKQLIVVQLLTINA
jgi:hypothetical protein